MNRIIAAVLAFLLFCSPTAAQFVGNGSTSSLVIGAPIVGGFAGCVVFQSANSVACDSGLTYAGTGGPVILSGGTVSGSGTAPFLTVSGTWNTSGLVDGGVLYASITDTASNGASLLVDLYVNSARTFAVDKGGVVYVKSGIDFTTYGITLRSDPTSTNALIMQADNGTQANIFAVANIGFGCQSNSECFYIDWQTTANVARVGTHKNGTGVARDVSFITGDTEFLRGNSATNNPKFRTSSTGAGVATFTNSPCVTLTTEQWIPVEITGQTGTWFIPACK